MDASQTETESTKATVRPAPQRQRRVGSVLGAGVLIGAIGVTLLAAAWALVVVYFGLLPANADASPPGLETWAAMHSLHATLRRDAPKGPAPLPLNDENLIDGIRVYTDNCMICHGGPDALPSAIARGLYQPPPQLARDGVEDDPAGYTYWKVAHGIRWTAMPAFDSTLTERQIWQVALFLKHMNDLPPAAADVWRRADQVAAARPAEHQVAPAHGSPPPLITNTGDP
jgi:thiosulfate dehydrogenase